MKVFLHQRAIATEIVEVDLKLTVKEFGANCLGEVAHVWLEGGAEPLDPEKTLEVIGITELCHIHISVCKAVDVKIRFGGDLLEGVFTPATSAESILKWAAGPKRFKLTDSEVAKHVIAICDTDTELDLADHIGFYADDYCAVCLDLLPKERFEG